MTEYGVARFSLSWLVAMVLIVLALGLGFTHVVDLQRQRMLVIARENADSEIALLQNVLRDSLQRQEYDNIPRLLQNWGRIHKDTVKIVLKSANGLPLGAYQRDGSTRDTLFLKEEITYSYPDAATVELTKDLAAVALSAGQLEREMAWLAGATLITLLLLTWSLARRKREAANLRRQSEELDHSNLQLGNTARDLERLRGILHGILDSIPSVLVGVDDRGCVTEWNKAAAEATHIAREDALGLPFSELLPHLAKYEQQVKEAVEQGRERRLPRLTQVTGGTVRYLDLLVYPLSAGDGKAAVIRVDDATQKVRFEQMMVQNEKMMSLGGLAAGVAHEINSPLSGVLQNCQNIARRLSADLATNRQVADAVGLDLARLQDYLKRRKVPEFIDMVREAAERAAHIVTDMLAFSRRNTEGFEKVAAEEMLETAIRLASSDYDMRRKQNFRHIQIERDFATGLPLLHCDRTRIEQVILNLIKNAAQAMAAADTPAPRRILLRTRPHGNQLQIEVEDNGPGMSEQVRHKAFEPFFTTKQAGNGTGLGLSVSHFIVTEQHRGSIEVDPDFGNGTRFIVRLPSGADGADNLTGFSPVQ
jgi:PAS domain S-box-containing protein